MKRYLFALILSLSFAGSYAQVHSHALGIRGGAGNYGSGGELSYQHALGGENRLELDLGWRRYNRNNDRYSHLGITGIYQWVWNIEDGFNWYAGLGGQLGLYSDKYNSENDGATLSVGGQLGIEYDFNQLGAPIQMSFDIRPMWGFFSGYSGIGYGAAFSIRYTWD